MTSLTLVLVYCNDNGAKQVDPGGGGDPLVVKPPVDTNTEKCALTGVWYEVGSSDVLGKKLIFGKTAFVALSYDLVDGESLFHGLVEPVSILCGIQKFRLLGDTLEFGSNIATISFYAKDTITIHGLVPDIDDIKLYREREDGKPTLENAIWKLKGIVDVQKDSLTELHEFPIKCVNCYTLVFLKGYVLAESSVNSEFGHYIADYATDKINIGITWGTQVGEERDSWWNGYQWSDILRGRSATIDKFKLKENELKLYYNEDKNYLLFNSL